MDDWNQRLGFACTFAGRPELRASDGRRPENHPHLRHSLELFCQAIDYLQEIEVRVFRLPSNLIPYATHPAHPGLHWKKQIREARSEIAETRRKTIEAGLRLSFHPSQFVLLNSPRPEVLRASLEELRWQSIMLDRLGCGPEARVLIHVGGVYGDRKAAAERMNRQLDRLPGVIRSRLALENDDTSWNARQVHDFCDRAGIPQIFDVHHHACLPGGESWTSALERALKSWPEGVRPKIHLSSPLLAGQKTRRPRPRSHSDYIDPWMWARLRDEAERLKLPEFDVMLEAKRKDLAVLELRRDQRPAEASP